MTIEMAQGVPELDLRLRMIVSRYAAGLDRHELANLIRVSRQTVGNWEAGRTHPNGLSILAWAGACRVDPVWLETGEPGPGEPGPGIAIYRVERTLPHVDSNHEPCGFWSTRIPFEVPLAA